MKRSTGSPVEAPDTIQGEGGRAAPAIGSPADAFFAAFLDTTGGVRFTELSMDTEELVRVAEAFRAGERAASSCLMARRWAPAPARKAGQTLALAAGEWLLAERYDDQAALLGALQQAWEQV